MNQTLTKVYDIALEVRSWAEWNVEDERGYADMAGWCAIAAGELHNRLKRAGIKSELCMATDDDIGSHVFVIVDDHIVDVTATQFSEFSNEPVVILHEKEAAEHWFYQSGETFQTPKCLRQYQRKNRWPARQIVYA